MKKYKGKVDTRKYPVLSPEVERKIIFDYKYSKDPVVKQEAYEKIILHNQGLVYSIINKTTKLMENVEPQNFISYGVEGLYNAIQRFDLSKDLKFSTYAYFWVEKYVRKGIRKESSLVYIPDAIQDKFPVYYKVFLELKEILDRDPTSEPFSVDCGDFSEMEEALVNGDYGFTPELYKRVEECWKMKCVNSLNATLFDDDKKPIELLETIPDEQEMKSRKDNEMNNILRDEFEKIRHANPKELSNPNLVADILIYILDHPGDSEEKLAKGLGIDRATFRNNRQRGYKYLREHSEDLRLYCLEIE